jgi:hypothetical protein
MRRVRVRVRVRAVADQSDHGRNRNRNRDRDRSLFWLAPGPHGLLKLRCRVVSAPYQYGCIPGCLSPNPITRPFDTDTDSDSDSDPDLASPWTFSDDLKLGPETYTMMRRVRVRVRVRAVADQSDHGRNRNRNRNRNRDRNRDRSLSWLAPGPHGPFKLRCRVVSAPQQYGCGTRFCMAESHYASIRYRDR